MKHAFGFRKLGRTTSHRHAMLRNMVTSLIELERIRTTVPKAKEARKYAEKMITVSKKGGHEAFRQANAYVRTPVAVKKLVEVLGPRYQERTGGYTRIIRAGHRFGDWAPMCYLEYVDNGLMPLKPKKEKKIRTDLFESAEVVEKKKDSTATATSTTKKLDDLD